MSDATVSVGVLAVAAAPVIPLLTRGLRPNWGIRTIIVLNCWYFVWPSRDFIFCLQPESDVSAAGLSSVFPFVEGAKLNIFADC
jgi:hypothetical protein